MWKKLFFTIVFTVAIDLCYGQEQGIATLVREITPKPGTEVTHLMPDGEDIAVSFSDGYLLRFNKELNLKGEIAKADSRITTFSFSQNKQYLAIATSNHGTMRYEKDNYWSSSYKQSNVRFGYPANPVKSVAFDPYGNYLITTDSSGRVLIYINEDNKQTNSGNGNLIEALFTNNRVFGALLFGDAMLYLFNEKIASYNYEWNTPTSSESEKEPAKAEKGPELLQRTETIFVNEGAVCAALGPLRASIYYVVRSNTTDRLYKFSLSDRTSTLLYVSGRQINSIATIDGIDIYLALSDRIAIVREKHTIINIENKSDVSVSLYVNGSYERYIAAQTKIELIRRPGLLFHPSISSSSANVYFEDYDGKNAFNLRDKELVNLIIYRQYPLQIIPIESKILESHDMAINTEHNLHAFSVLEKNNKTPSLLVLDSNNHRLLYKLDYIKNISYLLYAKNLFVAEQNNIYAYGIRSGNQEDSWQVTEDIKGLSAFGNKLLALSSHTINIIDTANKSQLTLTNNREVNLTACLTNEETYIILKNNAVEVYKFDNGNATLYHRVPRSWIGEPKHVVPLKNGAFSIITTDNRLLTYTGNPDQIEVLPVQLNKSLEFQYYYAERGLIIMRFINKSQNRIEDYDAEIPERLTTYFYIDPLITDVFGDQDTVLGKTENNTFLYLNESLRGKYYFFEGPNSAFIIPGNNRENDKFYPGSDSFDPVRNFRIRQNRDERDFLPDDRRKTGG
jgi:WD40 repeat protein